MDIKSGKLSFYPNIFEHVRKMLANVKVSSDGVNLFISNNCCDFMNNSKKTKNELSKIYISSQKTLNKNPLPEHTYQYKFEGSEKDLEYIEKILNGKKISLITIVDYLEYMSDSSKILRSMRLICEKYAAKLIVCVPNVCHKDNVFRMMGGDFNGCLNPCSENKCFSFFSAKSLEQMMKNAGFCEINSNDLCGNFLDESVRNSDVFLSKSTTIYQYLEYIKNISDPFSNVVEFVRTYCVGEMEKEEPCQRKSVRPFLSIVTRTQGKRLEALREVFLCLTAQTNTDFEVLLIGHKLTEQGKIEIESVVAELPDWLREKVRLVIVDHGNRTTPLNVGFEEAAGEYVSILDDDDIVFDNWVEEFYNMSKKHYGSILHAYAVSQKWEAVDRGDGVVLRAIDGFKNTYCVDFNLLTQLNINSCPTMSYACPKAAFEQLNMRFNENLTTTEDWDFLMRMALITGVSNSKKVTSIYRKWKNLEDSHILHSKREWEYNHQIIKNQFNLVPIALPKGYAAKIASCSTYGGVILADLQNSTLYIDEGHGFSQDGALKGRYDVKAGSWFFDSWPKGKIRAIRFDPVENGMIWIEKLKFEVFLTDGNLGEYAIDSVKSNGLKIANGFLFLKNDPQMTLFFKKPIAIKNLKISCKIKTNIPQHVLNCIYSKKFVAQKRNLFMPLKRKILKLRALISLLKK